MKRATSVLLLALLIFSCNNNESNSKTVAITEKLQTKIDSLQQVLLEKTNKKQISTLLTFQENNAQEAMNFYIDIFENSKIIDVQKHGKDGPAKEGTIFFARFELNGSQFACSDSYIKHEWDFTPGVSNFVDCKTDDEIETIFAKLVKGGKALMPLNNYGFSQKFGFVEDQFGVSWQLNLQ